MLQFYNDEQMRLLKAATQEKNNEINWCKFYLSLFKLSSPKTGLMTPVNELVTEGQVEIFHTLLYRPKNRAIINCCTQFGKSLFTALACIVISCVQKKIVAIIAPTEEKTKIIIRY